MANTRLTRTFSSGSGTTFTTSFWVKRTGLGLGFLFEGYGSGTYDTECFFNSDDTLHFRNTSNSNYTFNLNPTRKFRDVNSYYHLLFQFIASGDSGVYAKIYVNGIQETVFTTNTQGAGGTQWNNTAPCTIGASHEGNYNFNGIISHFHHCDGTALAPTVFGETDATTGEWKIKTSPTFTLGTNGFTILKDGNTITDQSSNSNDWSLGGGTLTKTEDCPDNVFATMNPLENHQQQGTYTNGNNTYQTNSSNYTYNTATLGVNSGKFYWEVEYDAKSGGVNYPQVGITSTQTTNTNQELGNFANDWGYGEYDTSPKLRNNNTDAVWGSAYVEGDIIGVALDCDNNKLYFSKNGTWQESGNPTAGSGGISITAPSSTPLGFYFPSVAYYDGTNNGTFKANFGNGYFGTTAVSSAGTNASNNGIFEYDVPTGYTALSTKGLNL